MQPRLAQPKSNAQDCVFHIRDCVFHCVWALWEDGKFDPEQLEKAGEVLRSLRAP